MISSVEELKGRLLRTGTKRKEYYIVLEATKLPSSYRTNKVKFLTYFLKRIRIIEGWFSLNEINAELSSGNWVLL